MIAEKRWPKGAKSDHETLFDGLIGWMEAHLDGRQAIAVGHGVVHGGTAFAAATRIDARVLTFAASGLARSNSSVNRIEIDQCSDRVGSENFIQTIPRAILRGRQ